jgi:uncharacterized membrane protein YdjX (TVP38/TMEM64 family)
MHKLWRPLLIICLALLVPVIPFLSFGGWLEERVGAWLDPPPAPSVVALGTVAILATDILLPIPSSGVSTVAGAQLGILPATAASWLGMTLGAIGGFWLARMFGRPLAERLSSTEDLAHMDAALRRYGAWILVATRALPVLAEAAVLFLGATRLSWRRFLPAVMLSNLGIAAVYSVLGHFARSQGELPLALAASIALPLLAATMARWLLPTRDPQEIDTPSALPPG